MARKRTGQLIWRGAAGWYGRFYTIIDGESVRVCRALGTTNKAVARRKLAQLMAADQPLQVDVKGPETFAQAVERIYDARVTGAPDSKGPREERAQLRRIALPILGPMPVTAIEATNINAVLDDAKDKGLSRQTVQHLRQRMANVFGALRREGAIRVNPVHEADMPKFADQTIRERAVLTDDELALYLAWEHPEEGRRPAVRERQTMACVARMFGGLRTGDLHALRWDAFDTEGGAFTSGYAPRQKTRRPQLLEVPAMLRPFLKAWWEGAGKPSSGLVFPVRRVGTLGDRVGLERRNVSHADAFRRDLMRAMGIEVLDPEKGWVKKVKPEEYTPRQRELFLKTAYTLPVDFHSWRRAYAQALADADVSAQQAAALAGHADLSAHMRYLRNAGKMRRLPDAALPALTITARAEVVDVVEVPIGHSSLGTQGERARLLMPRAGSDTHEHAAICVDGHALAASGAEGHRFESCTACQSFLAARPARSRCQPCRSQGLRIPGTRRSSCRA